MIVDTSALVAILNEEADAVRLSTLLGGIKRVIVPPHVVLEASMVLLRLKGWDSQPRLDRYLAELGAVILPFTREHAEAAREAFRAYGKGRHPAALNFGDCMSYAVAKVEGLPLLWVGEDFGRTDAVGASGAHPAHRSTF